MAALDIFAETQDIITNLVYFLLYFTLLVMTVRQAGGSPSNQSRSRNETAVIVLLLLSAQLSTDILRVIAVQALHWHKFVIDDVCTFLSVLLFAAILWTRTVKKSWNETKKKDIARIICACSMLAVLAVVLVLDLKSMGRLSSASQKYFENSTKLVYLEKNTNFRHSVRNLSLDYLITAILLSYWFFNAALNGEETPRAKTWGLLTLRIFLAVCAVFVLWGAKALLLPDSGIISIGHARGESISTAEGFYVNYKNKVLYRGSNPVKEEVCSITRGMVWMRNQRVAPIRVDGEYSAAVAVGQYSPNDEWMSVIIRGDIVQIFANEVITWRDGAVYKFFLHELKSTEKNYTLIALCEEMIKAGDWDFFEYRYAYLLQYDSDFITPYLARYATGNFTEEELSANATFGQATFPIWPRGRWKTADHDADGSTDLIWDTLCGVVIRAVENGTVANYGYGLERSSAQTENRKAEYVYDGRGSAAAELSCGTARYTFSAVVAKQVD